MNRLIYGHHTVTMFNVTLNVSKRVGFSFSAVHVAVQQQIRGASFLAT